MRGSDQRPFARCDSRMTPQLVLRAKKSVLPSGLNVGEPSFAGPEIVPGAKICGAGNTGNSVAPRPMLAPNANKTASTAAAAAARCPKRIR